MPPSKRAFRNATLTATIGTGLLVLGVQALFHPTSAWAWLWIPFVIFWLAGIASCFREFGKLEILWYLDRDAAKGAGTPTPFVSHSEFMQSAAELAQQKSAARR